LTVKLRKIKILLRN